MAWRRNQCPSHGLTLNETETVLAEVLLADRGVMPFGDASLRSRGFDMNNDGRNDSGADFWTAYVFHTRDIVRQCALDHMALIRMINSFDGERTWGENEWGMDPNGLAGDFDGDGAVDIGRGSKITMIGGSLGGIMATILGGLDPAVDAVAPIAGGGGLGNIGSRSMQGGVREAVILRVMAPIFTGTLEEDGRRSKRSCPI